MLLLDVPDNKLLSLANDIPEPATKAATTSMAQPAATDRIDITAEHETKPKEPKEADED